MSLISLHFCTVPTAICCFLICVSALLLALCVKHGGRVPNQSQNQPSTERVAPPSRSTSWSSSASEHSPMKLMKSMSKKAIPKMCMKMKLWKGKDEEDANGEGCLWKKTILMGEKCQPLQFSGSVYYDSEGSQVSEPTRLPKTNPLNV